jgi:hypothetical protein
MLSFARVRALTIVAVLVIGALVTVYLAISRDSGSAVAETADCPEDSVIAALALPEPNQIIVDVYNGTDQLGLASQVRENFANRDFQVVPHDEEEEGQLEGGQRPDAADEVALLRYGPQAVGAAHVLRAYFLDTATTQFDIEREGEVVEVVIGDRFRQLATETEVRQSIAALGSPQPPPGTCAGTDT